MGIRVKDMGLTSLERIELQSQKESLVMLHKRLLACPLTKLGSGSGTTFFLFVWHISITLVHHDVYCSVYGCFARLLISFLRTGKLDMAETRFVMQTFNDPF